MAVVKCLGSKSEIDSLDTVFSELAHLHNVFQSLADRLTDEEFLERSGAGDAIGPIMDQGLLLALANDRMEQVVAAGRELAKKEA